MINILLCGGSGTRLWPLSRTMLPKQFVRLFEGRSLFQLTIERNQTLSDEIFVVSNTEQYFLAAEQLEEVAQHKVRFLLEPVGRNTAPAIALACMALDPDQLVLVSPSDHLIKDQQAYEAAVQQAKSLALEGFLVTFGVHPTHPETGFGYIEAVGHDVIAFKEKPDIEAAQQYLEQGNFYWNAGMFCFQAGVFLAELEAHAPEIYQACLQAMAECENSPLIKVPLAAMQAIPEDSIDYAVMEKSQKVKMVPCNIGWSDLGSYDALYEELVPQEENTVLVRHENGAQPITIDAKQNLIIARERQIALVDVDDLLVVDTSDALLIAKKGSSQKVKEVVAKLKQQNPELTEVHRMVHRPWGTYEVLLDSAQYKIKRITVKPSAKLSLQKHLHRNEHWIVVSGTATVTVGEKNFVVRPNESTYIKMGEPHRLANEGKVDLVVIEVQVGEYTGEDDIIRLEDIYDRCHSE